jgi:hypothetical protein
MNTSVPSALDAADLLALARLDDDGAPLAVSPPRSADGQTSDVYRVARSTSRLSSRDDRPGTGIFLTTADTV